jgi:hypothetical protein
MGGGEKGNVIASAAEEELKSKKSVEAMLPPPFKKQKGEDATALSTCDESGHGWLPSENSILTEAVEACGEGNWEEVSKRVLNRSAIECASQWTAIQPKKGKWSKDEDAKLVAAYSNVYESENSSTDIPPNTSGMLFWYKVAGFIPGRSAVQCMARYSETLDPSLK